MMITHSHITVQYFTTAMFSSCITTFTQTAELCKNIIWISSQLKELCHSGTAG